MENEILNPEKGEQETDTKKGEQETDTKKGEQETDTKKGEQETDTKKGEQETNTKKGKLETDPEKKEYELKHMLKRALNDYAVEKSIGEGGFAIVYLVKHKNLEQRRALKIIKNPSPYDSEKNDLFNEAKMAIGLHHKNIIDIYDADTINTYGNDSDGHYILEKNEDTTPTVWPYIISEYVPLDTLEEYRKTYEEQQSNIPLNETINIIKQILEGLNVLHTANPPLIHRDLKTGNILMSHDPKGNTVVKIADFGLAKELTDDKKDKNFEGTKPYMAPELFKNNKKKKYSTQSDVYAIGVIFYQLLTNNFPHNIQNYTEKDLILYNWNTEVKTPSRYNNNIPQKIDEIIYKSLSTNPEQRYKDANEFLKAIEEVSNSKPNDNEISADPTNNETNNETNNYNKNEKSDINEKEVIHRVDLSFLKENIKTFAGVISIFFGILIYFSKPAYVEWYFMLFIIPAIGLIIQNYSGKNSRKIGVITIILGICILCISIYGFLNVYPTLTNLYLTNQISHVPTSSDITMYTNTYLMIIIYAAYNMLCGMLCILPVNTVKSIEE